MYVKQYYFYLHIIYILQCSNIASNKRPFDIEANIPGDATKSFHIGSLFLQFVSDLRTNCDIHHPFHDIFENNKYN